tara:strand:- start:127 stop:459 length:333 start_codon:yes stop_codon:yes gene_type:complete
MHIEPTEKELRFIEAYFEAMYFTNQEDFEAYDICEDYEREQVIECLAFYTRVSCLLSDDNIEQAGHDFWMSRNGHGVGFWDRPDSVYIPHIRDILENHAQKFGNTDVIAY